MNLRVKKLIVRILLVAFVTAFCLSVPLFAGAIPQAKLNEAKAAKDRADELAVISGQIVDEYNGAQEAYDEAIAKHEEAEEKLLETAGRLGVVQDQLNDRAVSMYRQGPFAMIEVLLGAKSFKEFTATWDILSDINAQNALSIDELSRLKSEQAQLKATLSEQEAIAAEQVQVMEAKKVEIENQIVLQQQVIAGLEEEIAQLRAEEAAAAQRAAEAAAAQPVYVPPLVSAPADPGPSTPSAPPTPSPPYDYGDIVSYAAQFIGVPYVWGGMSPAGFDCSGFVSYVYANYLGIGLPRTTWGMLAWGQSVGWADLQPGDLVFTHDGHVGLYVGGGQMLHAPTFGQVVSYGPVSPFYAGRRP